MSKFNNLSIKISIYLSLFSFFIINISNVSSSDELTILPKGIIKNLNLDYQSPSGVGYADFIDLNNIGAFRDSQLIVSNTDGPLSFSIENQIFEIDLSMLGVNDAEYIQLHSVSMKNITDHFSLNFKLIKALNQTEITRVRDGKISCFETFNDDVLSSCLKTSSINISKFFYQDTHSKYHNLMNKLKVLDQISIEDIEVTANRNIISGEFKSNITAWLKLKFEAQVKYSPEQEEIRIKLTKAKVGFFNVKDKIFKELAALNSVNLKVRKPYIYFKLKNTRLDTIKTKIR